MIPASRIIPPGDRWIALCWAMLCLCSLAILWSVTEPIRGAYLVQEAGVVKSVFYRQVVWVLLGWAAMLVASRIRLRTLENISMPAMLGMLTLLLVLLVLGTKISGSRRWLMLGPIRMQPAEFAKITFILATAHLLSDNPEQGPRPLTVITTLGLMLVHMVLIMREPDLGTSLVFLAVWVGMVFWYGIPGILLIGAGSAVVSAVIMFISESVLGRQPWPWGIYLLLLIGVLALVPLAIPARISLLVLNVASGLGIPFLWDKLRGYQQERILTFFDPMRDQFGTGYQAIQSKVAIGSGGLLGKHYLQGTQKGLAFLPERHTDFIFSVVGEELGLIGCLFLLALFLVIILRGLETAVSARQPFWGFVAVGIVSYFTFHVVVNVAITIGLMPVTGLPLPGLSYGGSNLLTSSLLVGVLLNISSRSFDV
ncbi:rod shape-determining protein RodA [bacterium CG_4_9_14_3_um_filter_65_15]|nr:MAG: rod shape-determining protein RodA [bacterium CG_4_9_14_3_um_filter_65_15]